MNDFVVFKTFTNRLEAEVLKGFLTLQKIEVVIRADDEGGMAPFPMQVTPFGVRLLIPKKDVAKATALMVEAEA